VLGLSWSEVDSVMKRAVKRGLARRGSIAAKRVGVDETSFQKRHEYVTVVSDPEKGRVLHVADDRKAASLDTYYVQLTPQQLAAIEVVTMDLCGAYIASNKCHVQGAEGKIAFDRFHVAALLSKAVDDVRRVEHRKLTTQGDSTLKGTRYAFLSSPSKLGAVLAGALEALKGMALKTSRAWAIKEFASKLWHYTRRGWAKRAWKKWISWASRCRLEPIVKAARTIRDHLEGILNAIEKKANNAGAESINAKIQKIKRMACGFRNRARFRDAIYFHLGGLNLYPALSGITHTKA
jgi:transposase